MNGRAESIAERYPEMEPGGCSRLSLALCWGFVNANVELRQNQQDIVLGNKTLNVLLHEEANAT